jgi:hypothetical protein
VEAYTIHCLRHLHYRINSYEHWRAAPLGRESRRKLFGSLTIVMMMSPTHRTSLFRTLTKLLPATMMKARMMRHLYRIHCLGHWRYGLHAMITWLTPHPWGSHGGSPRNQQPRFLGRTCFEHGWELTPLPSMTQPELALSTAEVKRKSWGFPFTDAPIPAHFELPNQQHLRQKDS